MNCKNVPQKFVQIYRLQLSKWCKCCKNNSKTFSDYKLVIICSSENEYKSPMISALDKYRAPKIAVAGVGKIKEYLNKKYTPENISDSAADVDSIR